MAVGPPPVFVTVACAAGICLLSLCGAGALRAQSNPPSRSIRAGAFTLAQADRGLLAYERACTKCHQSDLQGNQESEAPARAGEMFLSRWEGQSLKDLFDKVSTKMPADKPGSLPVNAYLDLVAYLLQANRFPAGSDELDLKPESLARTIIAGLPR